MRDREKHLYFDEDELAINIATSLKVARQLQASGKLTPEAVEVVRKAAYEFLRDISEHKHHYSYIAHSIN